MKRHRLTYPPASGGRGIKARGWLPSDARAALLALLVFALSCFAGVTAARAATGACPNEAVRGESDLNPETHLPLSMQLPDCRAYELVSPTFKDGFPINGLAAVSGDGSRMIVGSLGVFAGTSADPFDGGFVSGATYELARTGSGWSASAFNPSPALFPTQSMVGVSTDLSRTIWILRRPSESAYAADLYLREPDGSFVEIGPLLPPSVSGPPAGYYAEIIGAQSAGLRVLGGSGDLSRILFSLNVAITSGEQNYLWPGDASSAGGNTSLYEYAGTSISRPSLVGVSDGNTVVGGTTIAEGRLISDCGVSLGAAGRLGEKHNAVSASGYAVFFTAESQKNTCTGPIVNELYARINGSEIVPISEPAEAQCSICLTARTSQSKIERLTKNTATAVTEAPAEFAGASEDGSKVFFLTEQELLFDQKTLNLYMYDFHTPIGESVVLASGGAPGHSTTEPEVQGVVHVSEDGSHVYFVARAALTGANLAGVSPIAGKDNLYVFEHDSTDPQGKTTFVATLGGRDASDWTGESEGRPEQGTPDGRFLVFSSHYDLTPDDESGEEAPQLFEYDAEQEKLVRISIGQRTTGGYFCSATKKIEEGFNCNGNSSEQKDEARFPELNHELDDIRIYSGLAITSDGSQVMFESTDGLTPQAADNKVINELEGTAYYSKNIYEYHSDVSGGGGSIGKGNVYLISDGRDISVKHSRESGVRLLGIDASGGNVFFQTGDSLVAQDTDTQFAVYDARVDGGFPAPASPVGCEGEGCLPGASTAPLFGPAASVAIKGGGNLLPPLPPPASAKPKPPPKLVKCKKDLTRKHNKCVENKSKKKAKRASNDRKTKS